MMNLSCRRSLVLAVALLGLAGCKSGQNNPEEVKEKTAEATAAIKSNAKAVADGVREGWSRDKPLDLNSATRAQILDLSGITETEATTIVANRPYDDPRDLVKRGILSQGDFDKIADRVTAKK